MGKIKKIVRLLTLLNSRRHVTMKMINEVCDVPERTAYRYLNTISEAHVPVYWDKHASAYRLSRQQHLTLDSLSFGEAAILLIALKLLSANVNDAYHETIDNIISKIVVRQDFPAEEILVVVDQESRYPSEQIDLSSFVSSVLVNCAISAEREIRLVSKATDQKVQENVIKNPRLLFRERWHLAERDSHKSVTVPLEEMVSVTIP